MMTEEAARAWRPEIAGWSEDILPYYEQIAESLGEGATIVEVGVCHGRSLAFMCEQIDRLGKAVSVFGVDIGPRPESLRKTRAIFMQCASARAAERFEYGSLDFVFIDADHSYEGVRADIAAWLPKVKPGGILAGHDYRATDWPGVVRAVDEAFGAESVGRPTRTVWEVRR